MGDLLRIITVLFVILQFSCAHVKSLEEPMKSYAMTIDEIEALTHIDFFFSLPDKIEDEVEARINDEIWF